MAKFGRIALLGCTRDKNFTVDYYRKIHGPGIHIIGAHTDARPKIDSSSGMFNQRDDIKAILNLTKMAFNEYPSDMLENNLLNKNYISYVAQIDEQIVEDNLYTQSML